MKTLKKALVTGLVAVMMVVNLAGCGKFDAAAYVESCLDLLTKGETEQYMNCLLYTSPSPRDCS